MGKFTLCVLFLFPTSCSLMFVNGPPEHSTYVEPGECTTSNGWPGFDVVLAVLETARTGYAITRTDADYKGMALSRPADIAFGAALTALTAISAGVGFSRVSACREAMNEDRDRRPRPAMRRRFVAPPSYAPAAGTPVDAATSASPAAAPGWRAQAPAPRAPAPARPAQPAPAGQPESPDAPSPQQIDPE